MEWDWGATDALGDDLETLLESEATLLDFATPSDKPQAVAAVGLRCLDASHAAGCTLCHAPPATSDERSRTMLSGADGGLHGARAALLLTPEWNCARTREATAASLAASGEASGAALAAVLRAKASSQLSKDALMQLCAAWGYAHHAFRRKGDGARKRPRGADAAAAASTAAAATVVTGATAASNALARPRAAVDSVLLCAFDAASVAQFASGALSAAAVTSCGAMEGRRAVAAVTQHSTPHCLAKALNRYDDVAAACAAAARRLAQLRQAEGPWEREVLRHASDRGGAAALWLALPMICDEAPAEAALAMLRAGFTAAVRMHAGIVSDMSLSSAQAPPGDPRHVMALACVEFLDGIAAGLRFIATAEAALASARATADVPQYCALCDALLEQCERLCADVSAAFVARGAWSRRVLEPGFCSMPPVTPPPKVEALLDKFCAVVFTEVEAMWRDGLAAGTQASAQVDAGSPGAPAFAA